MHAVELDPPSLQLAVCYTASGMSQLKVVTHVEAEKVTVWKIHLAKYAEEHVRIHCKGAQSGYSDLP